MSDANGRLNAPDNLSESLSKDPGEVGAGALPGGSSTAIQRLPVRLDRYLLTKRLGVGGMAEVFLAQQNGPGGFQKTCVVKRILPHLAEDPHFVQMFQREARIAALLSHPNVVQLQELGLEDGIPYLVMEFVDGPPLHRLARSGWLNKKPMPLELICCAVADAALGLNAAHNLKDIDGRPLHLVHRDISPDNLMITREGTTKVLDFGIAKSVLSPDKTGAGTVKGKIPFLSPEQIRGEQLDARADLYSLGVTFYWLLTGHRPFHAATDLALLQKILQEPAPSPRALNPAIPPDVDALVLRLLAKRRAARPASGADVFNALEAYTRCRTTVVAPYVRELVPLMEHENLDMTRQRPGFLSTPTPESQQGSGADADGIDASSSLAPVAVERSPSAGEVSSGTAGEVSSEMSGEIPGPIPGPISGPISGPIPGPISGPISSPTPVTARDGAQQLSRRRRRAAAIGSVAGFCTSIFVALGMQGASEPADVPDAGAVAAVVSVAAPVVPTPTPPPHDGKGIVLPPNDLVEPEVDLEVDPEVDPEPPRKGDERDLPHSRRRRPPREVFVKAPAGVVWQTEMGRRLGKGSTTLKVPADATRIVAVDARRGAKTHIKVSPRIDYGTLPHGRIQPRANPYADVFLGSEPLGTTPLAAVDVVAGIYTIRFVLGGKEEKRVVEVKAGETTRANVDFTAK